LKLIMMMMTVADDNSQRRLQTLESGSGGERTSRATFEYDSNDWGRQGRVGEGNGGSGRRRSE
jgi:hypothetical protein